MTKFGALNNPPDYICYNETLCNHNLFSNSVRPPIDLLGNNSTCRFFNELGISTANMIYPKQITDDVYVLFRKCSSYHQPPSISNYSNLYACANSSKIISRHRLVDQVEDCLYGDDESYTESCSLSIPNHRFKCVIKNRTVCLARVRVNDDDSNCDDVSDEPLIYEMQLREDLSRAIAFTKICDGFSEVSPIFIDGRNETDETECSYFPCNNTYTRCNGIWNCPDGADEVNCEWPPVCPLMHQICLSPINGNFTCLHINRVNDGIIDCLGATDERQFCHKMCPSYICPHYRCSNSSICISGYKICFTPSPCPMTNDIPMSLCEDLKGIGVKKCILDTKKNFAQDFLCKLDGYNTMYTTYLSLVIPTFYYSPSQYKLGELQVFGFFGI
jgi:hypothetical protein